MENEFYYLVGDYMATGEGRTVMLMIIRPYLHREDYEVEPTYGRDENGNWFATDGVPKITLEEAALRDFTKQYGDWFGRCGQIVTRDYFMDNYGEYVPEKIKEITDHTTGLALSLAFSWNSETHVNGS